MSETPEDPEGLWAVCRMLPTDFEPFGERSPDEGRDCSCGCRYFLPLHKPFAFDWGICANPKSPRAGMLTFDHQGCPEFEPGEGVDESDQTIATEASESEVDNDQPELQTLRIDWFDLDMAMESIQDFERYAYLNKITGEVFVHSPDFDDEDERNDRIQNEPDWVEIEPIDSRTGYRFMQRFAESQKKPHVRNMLIDALTGNRPFRRFKDTVQSNLQLRDEWRAFEAAARKEHAEAWLAGLGIKPQWTGPDDQKPE